MSPRLEFLLFLVARWVNRHQQDVIEYLKEENRVLREQLGGRRPRLDDDQRRRLAAKGKALGLRALREVAGIVTPDTILRWYRLLIARKYDGSRHRRGQGRPRTPAETAQLIVRVAAENPRFGYTRIRDVVKGLGHEISRTTVQRVLAEHGIEPAPERRRTMPWRTFLRAHWDVIAAADFFTVEVLAWRGLVRYAVSFVIELKTRRVEIAGVTCQPSGEWMEQVARNLTDAVDGFLAGKRFLILDRDPLYAREFRKLLKGSGVQPLLLPARSPNLNAHAERFVLSVKSECLDHLALLGEEQLRRALSEYVEHYHAERHHQGLGSVLIEPGPETAHRSGPVLSRTRLGGLLKHYYREAA